MKYAVVIRHGEKLACKDHADPYVEVCYGKETHTTTPCKDGGPNAQFNTTYTFQAVPGEEVRFVVKTKSTFKDDTVGLGSIHEDCLRSGVWEGAVPLSNKKGEAAGQLMVAVKSLP